MDEAEPEKGRTRFNQLTAFGYRAGIGEIS
jgi:hypothetical protein